MGGRHGKMKSRGITSGCYSKLELIPEELPPPPQYDAYSQQVQQACRLSVLKTLRSFKELNNFQQNQVGNWGIPASGLLTRLQLDLRGAGIIGEDQRIGWQNAAWYADHVVTSGVPIDNPTLLAGLVIQ